MGDHQETKAIRVVIRGRVQGVWFRAWTAERAQELDLKGWVRNRLDGTVEALFAGPEDALEDMLALVAEGPPAASVDGVERFPVPPEELAGLGRFFSKSTV
jgi:acylphosphatase